MSSSLLRPSPLPLPLPSPPQFFQPLCQLRSERMGARQQVLSLREKGDTLLVFGQRLERRVVDAGKKGRGVTKETVHTG